MSTASSIRTEPVSGLSYRVLEPAPAKPAALVVLLHGVGGNETNLVDLVIDRADDTLVVLVRSRLTLAPDQYAWFRVGFTPSGPQIVPEEAEQSRLALIQMVATLQAEHGIAPARTVIAGFSQGGILSASVGLSSPDSVAGFAVLSGRILPEIEPNLASNDRLAKLHVLIAHGRADGTLPVAWADRSHDWLGRLGVPHDVKLYQGGHMVTAEMQHDFNTWLATRLASHGE